MRAVRVDPAARRAWVQGGALWGDVDCETVAFGLATPGGLISQTGVAGLTLSGGFGWLRGTHGLCVDNLEAVDIVTADGRFLHADADEYPTCSGPCVAAAVISEWSRDSPSACIRSHPR
jgi:FAD/FMN-containing dehydrogenase